MTSGSGSNWILWTALGLCVGLMVWSHNTNANNISELAINTSASSTNLNDRINNSNQNITEIK